MTPRQWPPPVLTCMGADHLEQVLSIEREVFAAPWSAALWVQEVQNGGACTAVVLVPGSASARVGGYIAARLVAGECELRRVATAPDVRRQGIARTLMGWLLERAWRDGASKIVLEVDEGNMPARRLYESLGFTIAGRRLRYYPETGHDGLTMILGAPAGWSPECRSTYEPRA